MGTWQAILGTIALGLGNGGPSGLLYTYIIAYAGFILVIASMAEMASMAPTAGGQYHWVSEFAPRKLQKLASYYIGWLSVMGYQVGVTITAFLGGAMIQGLITLNYPETYIPQPWHTTLIAMAITFVVALFNIFLANHLPLIEGVILVLHFAGFLAIVVVLWVLGPRSPSSLVWNNFIDAGWGSTGLASMVGLITSAGSFAGGDAPAHMAEELRNASKILPLAMLWTVIANGAMGLIMIVTFLYTMGDPEVILASPTGFPIIAVFEQATGSVAGATAMTCIIIILGVAGNLTNMAGASRQMFAFARDQGLPANKWLNKVPPRFDVPVNAVLVSTLIAFILHCIAIGSSIAFNIILSIGSVSLITSYMVSLSCITWRRIKGLPLLETRFSLGRAGLVVNIVSILFLLVLFVMSFFPPIPNPPPSAMNWAVVVYGAVLIMATIYWFISARHNYVGPVEYVRKSA